MADLLPCPFCGGDAFMATDPGDTYHGPLQRAQCKVCGADVGGSDTAAQAIAAWNRRASPPSPPAVWSGEDSLSQSQPCGLAATRHSSGLDAEISAAVVELAARAMCAELGVNPDDWDEADGVRVHRWELEASTARAGLRAAFAAEPSAAREPCDRVQSITGRMQQGLGWRVGAQITQVMYDALGAHLRIALDTEVEAGGPYLNNGWNRP